MVLSYIWVMSVMLMLTTQQQVKATSVVVPVSRVMGCKFTASVATSEGSAAAAGVRYFAYDFCQAANATATVALNDSYPEPYLIAPPFAAADVSHCSACTTDHQSGANAYQFAPGTLCAARCLPLGVPQQATAEAMVDGNGVLIHFGGGIGGRVMTHNVTCVGGASTAALTPADLVSTSDMSYGLSWSGSAGCGQAVPPPPPPPLPKPTVAQLAWMQLDIGAIGHFNMATFQACGIGIGATGPPTSSSYSTSQAAAITLPPPQTFAPTEVDTDSWVAALASFGAKRAVLVVSHGCGFNTFPSRTAFPEFDFEYNYTVRNSPWKGGKGDIAADFVASCRKYGIRPGFYHGAMNNAFLNVVGGIVQSNPIAGQARITQDQYTKILLANLRQLWSSYGQLAEVWFDGGYPPNTAESIAALLAELQPNAVAFQGPGHNIIRWVGTESGHPNDPIWSTAKNSLDQGGGDPDAPVFVPAEADTCLQGGRRGAATTTTSAGAAAAAAAAAGDSFANKNSNNTTYDDIRTTTSKLRGPYAGCWFYNPDDVPKSHTDLIDTYHDTIGRNAFLLLDWTPMPNGTLRTDHIEAYKFLGDYVQSCYGHAVASGNFSAAAANQSNQANYTLKLPAGADVDRVVLAEDLSEGQRVRSFSIAAAGKTVYTGTSLGHKHIALLPARLHDAGTLEISVTGYFPTHVNVAAFNCTTVVPPPASCNAAAGLAFKGPVVKAIEGLGVDTCCDACRRDGTCAVYNLNETASPTVCSLLSAQSGRVKEDGVVSGTPSRYAMA